MEAWMLPAAIRSGIEIKRTSLGQVVLMTRWLEMVPPGRHRAIGSVLRIGPNPRHIGDDADDKTLDRFAADMGAAFRRVVDAGVVDFTVDETPLVNPTTCPVCHGTDLVEMQCDYGSDESGDRPTIFTHEHGKRCEGAPQRLQRNNLPSGYGDIPPGTTRVVIHLWPSWWRFRPF